MRPIGGVRGASKVGIGPTRDIPAATAEAALEPSRALIAVEAATPVHHAPSSGQRPYAGFLAQLIATAGQLPQTRERRRAEPEDAIAAYRSAIDGAKGPLTRKFSRSS
jgi:hypothetical protein